MANYLSKDEDLVNNPSTRVPICLCLDLSGSMNTVEGGEYKDTGKTEMIDGKLYNIVEGGETRVGELQNGLKLFFDAIKNDEMAVDAAEISIVGFSNSANKLLEFSSIEKQQIPALEADGQTAMGEGVNMALDMLEERKNLYKKYGIQYFQPWLVIMSDGENNGSPEQLQKAIQRVETLANSKKLTVFAIAIGKEADMNLLSKLSPRRRPMRLQGMKFKEFFEWLSKSVSRTSSSLPGVKVQLPPVDDWGTL